MKYPNNDLWTVRSIDLLEGALEDMEGKRAKYYPNMVYQLAVPGVANYKFKGVLDFEEDDRTIQFEQGLGFGLTYDEIVEYLQRFKVQYTEQY